MRLFVQPGKTMRLVGIAAVLAVLVGTAAAQVKNAAASETEPNKAALENGQSSIHKPMVTYTVAVRVNPVNGGTVSRNPNQTYYAAGTSVNIMAVPASGYKFTGWSGDVTDTTNPVTVTIDGNKALTANFQYILKTYTLTTRAFPSDGGTVTRNPNKETYAVGEEVTMTATPEIGYMFTGWAGAVAAGRTNRLTVTMDGNKTITANFYKQSMSAPAYQPPTPAAAHQKPGGGGSVTADRDGKKHKAKSAANTAWGMGVHWGFDFSMSMKNGNDIMDIPGGAFDLRHFPGFELPEIPEIPDDNPDIPDITVDVPNFLITDPYLKMSRSDWERSPINFGGKLFVDVVPYIETIELSFNLGVWQYNCVASYLDVDSIRGLMFPDGDSPEESLRELPEVLPYKDVPLTLKEYNLNYLGLDGTPYLKLQLDASVRKTVFNLWRVKFNAGAGVSVNFATPLLNSSLIEAVQNDRKIETAEDLVKNFMDDSEGMGQDIVKKILSESLIPRFGAHIAAGARLKMSVVGIYVDGKLLIPISKYDENKQVKSLGILINTGLSLLF